MRAIRTLGTALVMVGAGCGDDVAGPDEGGLSEAEAVAILRGINALMADIDASDGEGGVFSCPGGGQMELVFAGSESANRMQGEMRFMPHDCIVTHGQVHLTLRGDPRIRAYVTFDLGDNEDDISVAGGIEGGVNWELGDRSGNCDIDLALEDVSFNPQPGQFSPGMRGVYRGRLCGYEIEIDIAEIPYFIER